MANLTRSWRWETFHPDIGENLDLPPKDRLALRIASALPGERLERMRTEYGAALVSGVEDHAQVAAAFARVFGELVEVVGVHTIDGAEVRTLEQYLAVVVRACGIYGLTELVTAVGEFNSIAGTHRLFSERHSGGLLSTRAQTAAPSASPMVAR